MLMTRTYWYFPALVSPHSLGFFGSSFDPTGTAKKLLPMPRYNSKSKGKGPGSPALPCLFSIGSKSYPRDLKQIQ